MVTRLAPDARSLFPTAEDEARSRRSPVVEAEHLLLALTAQSGSDAARLLASVGLTHADVVTALDREFESSLAAAGVDVTVSGLTPSSPDAPHRLRLGASFKAAMTRSVTAAAGSRRIRPEHLLLGILGAEVGTVPRALRLAGVDQAELAAMTEQAIGP